MQNEREKFKEDFVKRLVRFSVRSIKFAERLKAKRHLWTIADQYVDSSTSIGANVIEAKSSSSRRDYLRFFEIALKSANETKYWLIVIQESEPEFLGEASEIYKECDEISRVIGSSVLTLKGRK
jgi:four helix bundle protein